MNKVILMGRAVRDPEIKFLQGETPLTIANYTLAVNKRFKRQGEADADFINCVALGKAGEFAEKFIKKGGMFTVVGRLQVRSWEDKEGQKRWTTEVFVEEHYFTGGKNDATNNNNEGFTPIEDDDCPWG